MYHTMSSILFNTFFHLTMCTQGYLEFFLFCLDLELFAKTKKELVSTHSIFTFLLITQDLNKKNPEHASVQNFSKKY